MPHRFEPGARAPDQLPLGPEASRAITTTVGAWFAPVPVHGSIAIRAAGLTHHLLDMGFDPLILLSASRELGFSPRVVTAARDPERFHPSPLDQTADRGFA